MKIKVELSGGLELLFDNRKSLDLKLEGNPKVKDLIITLKDDHIKENVDLFYIEKSLRPGVLVLINDTDWELEGEEEYELQDGDSVCFISTLHGG